MRRDAGFALIAAPDTPLKVRGFAVDLFDDGEMTAVSAARTAARSLVVP